MSSIRPLIPLLIAAGILLGGNGLQATLIALRGAQEGFSPTTIGWMGTSYFTGFLLGCLVVVRMMRAVGYIRSFAALAATAACCTLMMIVVVDPLMWNAMRFASGFCFAGLFTVMESWLNAGASNNDRARVLALYRIVDISAVTGSQFLIPLLGTGGFTIFAVMAMLVTFSLVPVSLADRSNPQPPEEVRLDLKRAWAISPLASLGCITVGMTNSAFRTVGPIYAEQIGMSVSDVVIFVSLGIIGSVLVQYPLGALSDRWDRRMVLLLTTIAALVLALCLAFLPGNDRWANFVLVFLFGSFAMPLFSLSAAHANDRATGGEYVLVSAALMFFYSVGAIVGPIAASYVMQAGGPHALFLFTAGCYSIFVAATLIRMGVRPAVPGERRRRFRAMLRTSFMFARLAGPKSGARSDRDD